MYADLWGGGSFKDCIAHLDHLEQLGVTCIWLLPILESPMRDAGFDISNYHQVRADLGGNAEFDEFVRVAQSRGMSVMFDIAMNHCSSQHPWFVEASSSVDSPLRDWFIWSKDASEFANVRVIFDGMEDSNWAKCGDQYYFHRFFSHQPDLNYK